MGRSIFAAVIGLGAVFCMSPQPAFAQSEDKPSIFAFLEDRFMVRTRALLVAPVEDFGSPIGGTLDVDNNFTPELDFTFFFTKNLAAELILATTDHQVIAFDTAVGDVDVGEVTLLPPTLTLQYHFFADSKFKPYIGAGVNFTLFFDDDVAPGQTVVDSFEFDESVGFVAQIGFDYFLTDNLLFNVDLKRVALDSDLELTTPLGQLEFDAGIDPFIAGLGFGWRF
ncbi:MAG: OmpW family protein [Maricaulaceae bacterium]